MAIASSYGVVRDIAELGAESTVGGTAQFGLPYEGVLGISHASGQSNSTAAGVPASTSWARASDTAAPSLPRSRRVQQQDFRHN